MINQMLKNWGKFTHRFKRCNCTKIFYKFFVGFLGIYLLSGYRQGRSQKKKSGGDIPIFQGRIFPQKGPILRCVFVYFCKFAKGIYIFQGQEINFLAFYIFFSSMLFSGLKCGLGKYCKFLANSLRKFRNFQIFLLSKLHILDKILNRFNYLTFGISNSRLISDHLIKIIIIK